MNRNTNNSNVPYRELTWQERVPLFDNSHSATHGTLKQVVDQKDGSKPSRDAEDMLIKARRKPYLTMTGLYAELGLSGYRGLRCKQELVRLGLAEEIQLPANRRGRRKKLLQVMPRGTAYLKELGIVQGTQGRGGAKHLYYQYRLKEWYEKNGYTAEVEAKVGNTSVDLLVLCKDGTRLGVELALSPQYEEINALKAVGAGIERLLFVVETQAMMEMLRGKVKSKVRDSERTKIGFKLVSDYLKNEQK